jgi:maltooligosyltrehalose trehalohydrolase
MGEEYAETRPFPFFCSFADPELIEAVRRGRREEFAALDFRWGEDIPDPQALETFESARLSWQWPEESFHAQLRRLFGDMLKARRAWPLLRDREHTSARLIHSASSASRIDHQAILVVGRGTEDRLIALANLSPDRQPLPDFALEGRTLLWSTEEGSYGGRRDTALPLANLHPYELVLFGCEEWLQ